jgi:PKD repeat protein
MKPAIFLSAIAAFAASAAAAQPQQGLYSSGTLTILKGSTLYVRGNVTSVCRQDINIINRGELHLTGDLINEAGTLFRASSSGVDTVDGAPKKTSGGAVYFAGLDTQRIAQREASQGILFCDAYHSSHLILQGGSINVVGGLHFNGTHHIFNGGYDVRLFEKDSINHDLCRGYLSGERSSSRLYGSGKLYSITNDWAYWRQLDSLGISGIPKEEYASVKAVRVVRADSIIQETGDGSLARYFDLTTYGSNIAVDGFTLSYLPSQLTAHTASEESFAIFQKNLSNADINNRYKRTASHVNLATGQVTAAEPVKLTANQTSRFTIASTRCANPPRVSMGADVDVCHGSAVHLTATLSNYDHDNRGGYLYRWSHGEGTESVILNALQPGSSSTYSVEVEDRFGCRGWDTITVRCHPVPRIDSVAVGPRALQCENQPAALYAAASGCEGEIRYSWRITKTDNTFERAMDSIWGAQLLREQLAPGAYAVNLKCTSGMGCVSERSGSITVEQMPTVIIACERKGEYVYELRNESSIYSSVKGTQWIINGVPAPEQATPYRHHFTDTGMYAVKLVANGQACIDSAAILLHITPYGSPDFTTQKEAYCTGEEVQYANASRVEERGVSYLWRFGDGSISQEERPVKAYARAGAYADTLTATFPDGTVKRTIRSIQVNPTPRAGFDADSVHTCGSAYELTAADGSVAAYLWSDGSATRSTTATQSGSYSVTLVSAQGCASTSSIYVALNDKVKIDLGGSREACGRTLLDAQNPGSDYLWSDGSTGRTLEAAQSGSYGVHVIQPNGCTDSARVTLAIHPLPDASLGSRSVALCENSSVTLAPAYAPENAYRWSNGSVEPSIRVEQAGEYSVRVSSGACSSADTVRVYALPAQQVSLGGNRFLCSAEPALFTLPEYLSAGSVRWYKQGEGLVSEQAGYLTAEAGVYSVLLTYPNGCTASDTVRVEHSAAGVHVDFLVVSEAEVGDTLRLIDLSYPDVTQRTWTISDGFSSSEKHLYHAFFLPGDKIVTLTAGNEQCSSQRSKRISITDRAPVSANGGSDGDADSAYMLPADSMATAQQRTAKYVEIEEVKVYPNPSSGTLYVAVKLSVAADMLIELYSVTGALIRQVPVRNAAEHTETFSINGSQPSLHVALVRAGSERKAVKILRAAEN